MSNPESRPKRTSSRSTIYDVARLASVSYQTVSRVVNEQANVSGPTRAKVLKAIKELNYQPNIVAKSLVTRSSQLFGLIAYGTEQYGPAQVVQSIERSARTYGYEIILTSLSEFKAQEISLAVGRMSQFGVDGLILLTPYDTHEIVSGLDRSLPFILIDATSDVNGHTVSIDQMAGGVLATEHLIGLGHTRILHVSGPSAWSDAELRYRGYLQALADHQLAPLPRAEGDWSPASGYEAVTAALKSGPAFTAIVAGNDHMALGAIAALREAGLSVPADVSVVGFDDLPETPYLTPGLTTVMQDFTLLGRTSVSELILALAEPAGTYRHVIFRPHLVERASTAALQP